MVLLIIINLNLQEAEKLFLKAIELNPSDASYVGNLGMYWGHFSTLVNTLSLLKILVF